MALARVQAERDQQEKDALEKLRSQLEQDKSRVQEELDAERAIGLDKDTLLERCKKRESDLEEDVIALQLDLDTLDSQLDRAMQAQKSTESKYEVLKEAFEQAAEHLALLEADQKQWKLREAELQDEIQQLISNSDATEKHKEELDRQSAELRLLIAQKEEDLRRLKERSDKNVADLEIKLSSESSHRSV